MNNKLLHRVPFLLTKSKAQDKVLHVQNELTALRNLYIDQRSPPQAYLMVARSQSCNHTNY